VDHGGLGESRQNTPHARRVEMGIKVLANDAWKLFDNYKALTYLDTEGIPSHFSINQSIPILYFGNINKYFDSEYRIVTAALNPSSEEFPITDPYIRFPQAKGIDSESDTFSSRYLEALNEYFETGNHYKRWFGQQGGGIGFEAILNGMRTSFFDGGGYSYRALHTDVGSPVATDPKWSSLKDFTVMSSGSVVTDQLLQDGVSLWWRLMDYLKPNVIILSIGLEYFESLGLPPIQDWSEPLYIVNYKSQDKQKLYHVMALPWKISSNNKTLIVSGSESYRSPFQYIKKADKIGIGKTLGSKIGMW
jgi:hypothetical protein